MNTWIQTPTPELEASLAFYNALGFERVTWEDRILYSDGHVVIEINKDPKSRKGMVVYSRNLKSIVEKISDKHSVVIRDETLVVSDPSGNLVYFKHGDGLEFTPKKNKGFILGKGHGLTLEVIELGSCIDFYQLLGFELKMGSTGEGWVMIENEEGFKISLMALHSCPHMFPGASLSYFNGKNNLEVIANVRKAGIPIYQEITVFNKKNEVDNIILQDPGGLGFFIFNDE